MHYSYESESIEREKLTRITCAAVLILIVVASISLWNISQTQGGRYQIKISQAAVSYLPSR
jgi:hypothetical protein